MIHRNLHQNEHGQTALETAIILIAFIVVASIFALTLLSAGSSSTEGREAALRAEYVELHQQVHALTTLSDRMEASHIDFP